MTLIGIACIIVVVVGSVHFVYKKAFSQGYCIGVGVGRLQILEENVKRTDSPNYHDMLQIVDSLTEGGTT